MPELRYPARTAGNDLHLPERDAVAKGLWGLTCP